MIAEFGADNFEIVGPAQEHPSRAASGAHRRQCRREGHEEGGRGLSRIPLLAGGPGAGGQALLPSDRTKGVAAAKILPVSPRSTCSGSTGSAAGRRRRPRTSPTAACSTRSTSRPTDHGRSPHRRARYQAAQRHPGLRAGAGRDPGLSEPDRPHPACGDVPAHGLVELGRVLAHRHRRPGVGGTQAELRCGVRGGGGQPGHGHARGLGAGALRLPIQAGARRRRRPAVRAADRRGGHLAGGDLRSQRPGRAVPRAPGDQGRVHALGRARGAHLREPALRRPHGSARDPGPQPRRRGGVRDLGRHPAADARPRRAAVPGSGHAHRGRHGVRQGGRRVRLGDLHRGQPALRLRDRPAA